MQKKIVYIFIKTKENLEINRKSKWEEKILYGAMRIEASKNGRKCKEYV